MLLSFGDAFAIAHPTLTNRLAMPVSRALSIRQPWVELILRGVKTREYRSRPTKIRERVYLYASLQPARYPPAWQRLGKHPGDLSTGRIVGTVEIVDCRWDQRERCYAYVLRHPRRMKSPRRAKNQPLPGFWRPRFRIANP